MKYFNNQNWYRIGFFVILTVMLSATIYSCDSLLNKEPLGELTSGTFFETPEDAIQATNASYAHLRSFNVHVFSYLGVTDMASDDADKGSTPNDASFLRELDEFTFNPGNGAFSGIWNGYYQGIQRTNQAIVNIPEIEGMDQELQSRLVGENKFIRAYLYFFLARSFGGVPLITEPFTSDDYEVSRSSLEETYNLIEQDLRDAIESLPLKSEYGAGDLGRATRGAAQGLLAKVHLFQEEYSEAQDYAEDVIASTEYSLYPDYEELFRREGENSEESLFEIQATSTETNDGGTQFNQVQGVRGVPNLGWGFNNPSVDLNNSYEPGDPRQEATIMYVWEQTPEPLIGGFDVVRDNPQMIDERYNQKAFVTNDRPGSGGTGPGNIRRLRYADVLLIAAEAAYHNNDQVSARNYVNQVRERARQGRSATVGISVEPFNFVLADTTGFDTEEGKPFIRYVDDQGTASGQGFQPLQTELVSSNSIMVVNSVDVIQAVDGTPVASPQEYFNIMAGKASEGPIQLEVLRITESFDSGSGTKSTSSTTVTATFTTQELLPDIPTNTTGQALLDAIWQERRVELAMEQHRFFDLRRQNRAEEVLQALGKNYESPKHDLYPIPQAEIDNTGGFLDQNPGYN